MSDPLSPLLVDIADLDRNLLAGVLLPYLQIDRTTVGIVPVEPAWRETTNETKVLLYLLARRAMLALGFTPYAEVTPVEIERATGMPGNSVRPALKRLLHAGHTERTANGLYTIPAHRLRRVMGFVGGWG